LLLLYDVSICYHGIWQKFVRRCWTRTCMLAFHFQSRTEIFSIFIFKHQLQIYAWMENWTQQIWNLLLMMMWREFFHIFLLLLNCNCEFRHTMFIYTELQLRKFQLKFNDFLLPQQCDMLELKKINWKTFVSHLKHLERGCPQQFDCFTAPFMHKESLTYSFDVYKHFVLLMFQKYKKI
jgi:hypothetical protein